MKHLNKYLSLFEDSNDLIQSVDSKGNLLFTNNIWKKTLNYTKGDIKKLNIFEIIHPDYIEHCKSVLNKVISGKKSRRLDVIFLTKLGKEIILQGNVSSIITDNKNLTTIAFFKDITKLEKTIEKLKIAEKKFKLRAYLASSINNFSQKLFSLNTVEDIIWEIVESVIEKFQFEDCVIYLKDIEGKGFIQKAVYGPKLRSKRNIINPIIIKEGEGIVGRVIKTKNLVIINDLSKDNSYIVDDIQRLSELAVPIILNDKVFGVIDSEHSSKNFFSEDHINTLVTISNLAAAGIQSIIDNEIRKEKENQFKAIVETTSLPIVLSSFNDSKIIFTNESFSKLVKTPINELIGRKIINNYANKADRKEILNELNNSGVVINKEVKLKVNDSYLWFSLSMKRLIINGKDTIFTGLIDITNQKKIEEIKNHTQIQNKKIQKSLLEFANQKINAEYSINSFIEKIVNDTFKVFNMYRCSVWLPNEKGFYLASYKGKKENPEGLDFLSNIEFSKYLKIMKEDRLLISEDVLNDNRLTELKDYFLTTEVCSMLDSAAVINDKIIAIFCYEQISKQNWGTEEVSFIRSISELVISMYLRLEEKNILLKLKESESRLNAFFNFAPAGIAINHMNGKFLKVNVEFSRITGYTIEELNELSYWDLTPKEYNKQEEIQLKNIIDKKAYGPYEKEYIRKDGSRIPVLLKGIILKIDNEDFIWSVIEDLTFRKKKENEVNTIAKEFLHLIENANAPIFGVDVNGKINEWNKTSEKITGFKKDEVIGIEMMNKFINDEDKNEFKILVKKALKGITTSNIELRVKTKFNKDIVLLLNFNIRHNLNGNIVGVIGIGQDITELVSYRKELEGKIIERTSELNEALKKEIELNKMKSKFVSIVSHEFRTPLSAINFAAGTMKSHWEKIDADSRIQKLSKIEDQVNHMSNLLEDILIIGKTDDPKLKYKFSSVNFNKFINPIIEEVRTFTNNTHKIIVKNKNADTTIFIDEKLGRNVFINILNNAIKFSPGENKIILEVNDKNNTIHIKVIDFGIGIEAKDIENIFNPFHRGENAESIKGSGLGLSIVKNSISQLKGKINLESVIDKGSTFNIYLLKK